MAQFTSCVGEMLGIYGVLKGIDTRVVQGIGFE